MNDIKNDLLYIHDCLHLTDNVVSATFEYPISKFSYIFPTITAMGFEEVDKTLKPNTKYIYKKRGEKSLIIIFK